MSADFDPYHKWQAIPSNEQSPHHYRRLGLALFEADRAVIELAADRQMTFVRHHGTGPHSEASLKLLNEISQALKLSERRQNGAAYRLPTEAEWEFSCRAGKTTRHVFGDDPADWRECLAPGEHGRERLAVRSTAGAVEPETCQVHPFVFSRRHSACDVVLSTS